MKPSRSTPARGFVEYALDGIVITVHNEYGVLRVAFAFDPNRKAILLVAGDKSGGSEKRFYRQLIETADKRFDVHVARIKGRKEKEQKERK